MTKKITILQPFLMQLQNPELAYEAHKKSLSIQEHGRVSSSINQQRHWINTII